MSVAVVDVRQVRVIVHHPFMAMGVRVGLGHRTLVRMLMVLVVDMRVLVHQGLVHVPV